MDKGKPTIGIYGIPDRNNLSFPEESHDHGMVLMENGKVVKSLQLERKTRLKNDHHLPNHLFGLLKEEGLLPGDFDIVFSNNVLGNSMISSNGKIRLEGSYQEVLSSEPVRAHAYWLDKSRGAWLVNHELAHIFSALPFYGAFPENTLLIHFDGGASQSNFSAWSYRNKNLDLIEAHWDLKYLSAFFNANALCFGIIGAKKKEQLSVPGKMMGLASYGTYSRELEVWLKENGWFSNIWGSKRAFFRSAGNKFGWIGSSLNTKDRFLQNIMATMQAIFIRETSGKIELLAKQNELDNLVFTGGSALNIVLNASLIRSGLFKNIMIPPCTNDSGLALGAAACLEYHKHGKNELHGPYMENWGIGNPDVEDVKYTDEDIALTAKWINDGELIGVCNGYGEAGPRALGNRSLICRADNPELARKLSTEIKGREWYRPLAPVMLKKNLEKYTGEKNPSPLGRFMLDEFHVLPDLSHSIRGAVHVDGTARIQYLEKRDDNPFMWDLLTCLEERFNLDCLINTSFNKRGEPIVNTNEDAISSAKNMGISKVVIQGKPVIIEKDERNT